MGWPVRRRINCLRHGRSHGHYSPTNPLEPGGSRRLPLDRQWTTFDAQLKRWGAAGWPDSADRLRRQPEPWTSPSNGRLQPTPRWRLSRFGRQAARARSQPNLLTPHGQDRCREMIMRPLIGDPAHCFRLQHMNLDRPPGNRRDSTWPGVWNPVETQTTTKQVQWVPPACWGSNQDQYTQQCGEPLVDPSPSMPWSRST